METLDEYKELKIETGKKKVTPNAVKGMIFGIVSIASAGLVITGVIFAILAFSANSKDMPTVNEDPVGHKSSGSMLKAARICGTIGLVVSGLYVIYYIFFFEDVMGF